MAANVGSVPHGILTADFDLRMHDTRQMTDESAPGYYFRTRRVSLRASRKRSVAGTLYPGRPENNLSAPVPGGH